MRSARLARSSSASAFPRGSSFRRRIATNERLARRFGAYLRRHDAVAVNWVLLGRCKADALHYYRILLHELLHATGHAKRLNRQSLVEYDSDESWRVNQEIEEGTVLLAEWLVLGAIGLPARVLRAHAAPSDLYGLLVDLDAAMAAAAWMLD
jgi:antirestriction protein ArdC